MVSTSESTSSAAEASAYSRKIPCDVRKFQARDWIRQAEVPPAEPLVDIGVLRIEVQAACHLCARCVFAPDVEACRWCGFLSALAELRYCHELLDRR